MDERESLNEKPNVEEQYFFEDLDADRLTADFGNAVKGYKFLEDGRMTYDGMSNGGM